MTDRVRVCAADDLPPGERTIVNVEGTEIGVLNHDGEYFALHNRCPHRGGPVCEGKTTDALVGSWPGPGERIVERFDGDPAIACPWHGWEFDMASGVHLGDDSYAVRTYAVVEDGGDLYVEL